LNNNNSLWSILRDTVVAQNLKEAVVNARLATRHISQGSQDLQQMISHAQKGRGLLGVLLKDTTLANKLKATVEDISEAGAKIKVAGGELKKLSEKLNSNGTVNMLLTDSAFREQVRSSLININEGTRRFSEDMEALKHNFLLRGYFKKMEREKEKEKEKVKKKAP
jgi:phospholipid/cholesterol/gamma-HCH transport system substrate-binding protein